MLRQGKYCMEMSQIFKRRKVKINKHTISLLLIINLLPLINYCLLPNLSHFVLKESHLVGSGPFASFS